ncbi:MAG: diol dehydratase small subunit [Anaerolineae bacterium]|nr:diol dehydratase small subunit [Anaerolineae bacterium]
MVDESTRSASGRTLDELNMENVLAGRLTTEDFRISGETLQRQADAAEAAGYRQLGDNLRRAAELTRVSNEKLFEIYEALRPGRATYEWLMALVEELENEHHAPRTAVLVREAAQVYLDRGLVKRE